jgi:hypothetical protein
MIEDAHSTRELQSGKGTVDEVVRTILRTGCHRSFGDPFLGSSVWLVRS